METVAWPEAKEDDKDAFFFLDGLSFSRPWAGGALAGWIVVLMSWYLQQPIFRAFCTLPHALPQTASAAEWVAAPVAAQVWQAGS